MSYSRFGCEGSDVYVILTDGWLECCGCQADYMDPTPHTFQTTDEMIAHLDGHRRIGHHVPDSCYEQLRDDKAENDAHLKQGAER